MCSIDHTFSAAPSLTLFGDPSFGHQRHRLWRTSDCGQRRDLKRSPPRGKLEAPSERAMVHLPDGDMSVFRSRAPPLPLELNSEETPTGYCAPGGRGFSHSNQN